MIHSKDNPRFRAALDLVQSARERRKRHETFLEGIHLCRAYAQSGGAPKQVFATESALQNPEVANLWNGSGAQQNILSPGLFKELSQVENGVAVAYVIETPSAGLPARIDTTSVYLDRVQDPGNVGTILRCCAGAGVQNLITSPGTAFCWAPKVLRAAMGAHFAVQIFEGVSWASLRERLAITSVATAVSLSDDVLPIWDAELKRQCLWLFGNEGAGLSDALRADVQHWVSIPISPNIESLNVAAAAAVCLFEQRRQQTLSA